MIALLLTLAVAQVDGGTPGEVVSDAPVAVVPALSAPMEPPFADPDAGIFTVSSAVASVDGGVLGPGWWISSSRMQKIGVALEQQEAPPVFTSLSAIRPFLYGLAVGVGVGVMVGVPLGYWIRRETSGL